MAITIEAAAREDMLAMTKAVRNYAATTELPPGYSFAIWGDRSIDVNDRLDLLVRNGGQGLILVFIALALFLELKLAFWVALGIPISILGSCALLWQFDQTLNMLSMFSFVIALGIVVDDAIVIGENIYAHRQMDKNYLTAAIEGTYEVLPSVAASVATTVFAFTPMFFVTGVMGKFFAVMPFAVIAMLLISLFESSFILPCHLAHGDEGERHVSLGGRILRGVIVGVHRADRRHSAGHDAARFQVGDDGCRVDDLGLRAGVDRGRRRRAVSVPSHPRSDRRVEPADVGRAGVFHRTHLHAGAGPGVAVPRRHVGHRGGGADRVMQSDHQRHRPLGHLSEDGRSSDSGEDRLPRRHSTGRHRCRNEAVGVGDFADQRASRGRRTSRSCR